MAGWSGLSSSPALGDTLASQTSSDPEASSSGRGVSPAQHGWHLLGVWRPSAPLAVKQGL